MDGTVLRGLLTCRHPFRGHGLLLEQVDQLVTALRLHVQRDEVHVVLRGRGDARLDVAVERHLRRGDVLDLGCLPGGQHTGGGTRARERHTGAREPEQPATRNPGHLADTTSATLLTGSPSASTASASALISSCVSSV